MNMTKLKFWIILTGLCFNVLPLKGFDIQSFLVTPEFFLKQTEEKAFEGFNHIKLEIGADLLDILREENIGQTIDSLLIKSACEDSSKYIKINERESMLIFFFKYACGMPAIDICLCDNYIHITDYVSWDETNREFIEDGNVETQEYLLKKQIDIMDVWYKNNKRYIKPIFIKYYIDLLSHYLALQYIYTIDFSNRDSNKPNKDPRADGMGVITGWKGAIWPNVHWKPYGGVTYEFALKANGLFKSLISMFYWYKRNNKNTLPPDYIIKCGIEMNNQPKQNCSNCREPELILW